MDCPQGFLYRYVDEPTYLDLMRFGGLRVHLFAYFREQERLGNVVGDRSEGKASADRPYDEELRSQLKAQHSDNVIIRNNVLRETVSTPPTLIYCFSDKFNSSIADRFAQEGKHRIIRVSEPLVWCNEMAKRLYMTSKIAQPMWRILKCDYRGRTFSGRKEDIPNSPLALKDPNYSWMSEWRVAFPAPADPSATFARVTSKMFKHQAKLVHIPT